MAAYPGDPAGAAPGRGGGPPAARPAHRPGRAAPGGGRRRQDRGAAGVPERSPTRPRCGSGCSRWPGGSRAPAAGDAAGRRWPRVGGAARSTAPGRPLHAVRNRDLLISQLLTPQAFLLPVGVAFVVAQFLSEGSWSFIAVASTLTAMAGVLLQPVRRVLDDWNFRLARDGRPLRVRNGLLETRAQTVPLDRVQTVGVTWPLLWRMKGWLRLRLEVAGYSGARGRRPQPARPAAARSATWRPATMIVAEVLPGVRPGRAAAEPAAGPGPLAAPAEPRGARRGAARAGVRRPVRAAHPAVGAGAVRPDPERAGGAGAGAAAAAAGHGARRHRRRRPAPPRPDRDLAEAWALAAELTARAARRPPRRG